MNEVAALGIKADSTQVVKATDDLDALARAATKASKAAGDTTTGTKKAEDGVEKVGRAAQKTDGALARMAGTMRGGFNGALAKMGTALTSVYAKLASLGLLIISGLSLRRFIDETMESEKVQAQLAARLESTGGAAGRTIDQLNANAKALQGVTIYGDEATGTMQSLLLTFTNIQGGVFDRATESIMNVATAMGGDLSGAALQVGKALNDPINGLSALSRSGIQFSDSQKEAVRAMVEMNNIAGAQSIILTELEHQFGGAARAARDTLGGALQALGNSFGDAFEMAGPASDNLRIAIESLISAISDPIFVSIIQGIGAALFNMASGAIGALQGIVAVFGFLSDNADVLVISLGVLAATTLPSTVAGLTAMVLRVGMAITGYGALTAATTALSFAMQAIPILVLVTGLTLAWRWYTDTSDATRAAEASTLAAAAANTEMSRTLQGVSDGLAQTKASLDSLSMTQTLIAQADAAKVASDSMSAMGASTFAVIQSMRDLSIGTLENRTQIANLAVGVRNGNVSFEEFRSTMDRVGAAVPALAPFVSDLINSIDAANSSADSVDRLAALMRYLEGEASAADMQLLNAGQSALALGSAMTGISLGGEVTGQVAHLAAQLGVALNVATALNATLNASAGIQTGASTGPGLSFGLSATAINDVSTAVLGFGNTTARARREIVDLSAGVNHLSTSLGGGGGGGGSGGGGLSESARAAEQALADAAAEAARLAEEMNRPLVSAVDSVSNAFGDFIAGGLRDFKGFARSILDSFKGMISQMIAFAVKNKIMIAMGMGGSVAGGAAAAATPGGGGMLGGLLGAFGSGGGGILGALGGGSGLLGGLGNAVSGGLGNIFSIGANAAAAGGGFMATLGAAVPILGAVALAISLFKKKVTELDGGLRLTADGAGLLVEQFRTIKTSRFFGLSNKTSTSFSGAGSETSDPINAAFGQIKNSVLALADSIGIGAGRFAGFSAQFMLSLKGMTDEQAQQAIVKALGDLSDQFAAQGFQWQRYARDGEGATAVLAKLSTSLGAVNQVFDVLGFTMQFATVKGAAMASRIVDMFGGLQNLTSATQAYYDAFYTDAEKAANATSSFQDAFRGLLSQAQFPQTIAGFRALVDQLMRTGRTADAMALIQLGPAFAQMLEMQAALVGIGDDGQSAADALAKLRNIEQERYGLMTQLLQVEGNTTALRARELAGLDNSNRALQRRIWAEQDAKNATQAATKAIEEAAAAARAVADERYGLRTQLLELQGNTTALRARELAGLQSNGARSIQMQIWAEQDRLAAVEASTQAMDDAAQAANAMADALTTDQFRTSFEFNRAVGLARNGQSNAGNVVPFQARIAMPATTSQSSTSGSNQSQSNAAQNRIEGILTMMHANSVKTAAYLKKWDGTGLPPARSVL